MSGGERKEQNYIGTSKFPCRGRGGSVPPYCRKLGNTKGMIKI
jgi:hypothetical protein